MELRARGRVPSPSRARPDPDPPNDSRPHLAPLAWLVRHTFPDRVTAVFGKRRTAATGLDRTCHPEVAVRARFVIAPAAVALALAGPLGAQSLRQQLSGLFVFAPWSVPLQVGAPSLSGTGTPTVVANDAFMPSVGQASATVEQFIGNWVGASIGDVPVSSTGGGAMYRFERGIPVREPVSPGPVLGERAQSIGRGALLLGVNHTGAKFTTLRGVPLSDVRFTLASRNDASAACAAQQGQSCAALGVPTAENDLLNVALDVRLDVDVTSFYATYGLLPKLDFGVVVPLVHTSLSGRSVAEVEPFGVPAGAAVSTLIGGTPTAPVLSSAQQTRGDATGLGDIATRLKLNLFEGRHVAAGVLADVRFPTGNRDDLLGSGSLSARGLAIVSGRIGTFSPHASAGYLYWREPGYNDALLATVGFDQQVVESLTLATSLVTEFQAGRSAYQLPQPVTLTAPYPRTILPSNIPNIRDDAVSVSFGAKYTLARSRLIGNVFAPVRRGGPRPDFAYTFGFEQDF
jgi:hypothetical protein